MKNGITFLLFFLILLLIATHSVSACLKGWDVMNFRVGGINSFYCGMYLFKDFLRSSDSNRFLSELRG